VRIAAKRVHAGGRGRGTGHRERIPNRGRGNAGQGTKAEGRGDAEGPESLDLNGFAPPLTLYRRFFRAGLEPIASMNINMLVLMNVDTFAWRGGVQGV
jgi:hypothetical protein